MVKGEKLFFDAYLHEYASKNCLPFLFLFQVPCLVVSPQNQHSTKTTEFVRWKEAWVYHFNTEELDLLDTDFKIVICYNGIHHFTSTKILSTEAQNKAIIKLLSIMGRNMNQLASNLQGCENVKNFIQLTHQQLSNSSTGSLNKTRTSYFFFCWSSCFSASCFCSS